MTWRYGIDPEVLRRGAEAARRLGDNRLAAIYEADADRSEQDDAPGAAATATEGEEIASSQQEGDSVDQDTEDPHCRVIDISTVTGTVTGTDFYGATVGVRCELEEFRDENNVKHFTVSFMSPPESGPNFPELSVDQLPHLAVELIRLYCVAKRAAL